MNFRAACVCEFDEPQSPKVPIKMTPGRFAIPTRNGTYYNSVRHSFCTAAELNTELMLAGQEKEAILKTLFSSSPFSILLIPSFECNLRCPHCYVGHLLQRPTGNKKGSTDPDKLIDFIRRTELVVGPLVHLIAVGGEPFLHPEALRRYVEAGLPLSVTTNGIFDFNEVRDIIGQLRHLTFSIDGWPEQHNKTRKPLDQGIDPFRTTYQNLCRTIENYPNLDVTVQGSLIDDDDTGENQAFRYFALMLAAGVKRDKISLGPCAATVKREATSSYMNSVRFETRNFPCCDHTLNKGIVVYANEIYPSYHQLEEINPIATLDDSIEKVLDSRKEFALNTMPLLHDPICMDECKAVGICWGMCTSARHVFRDGKPSSVCDRQYKEAAVKELAISGTLPKGSSCERRGD